jgi:phosphate transport system protein
MSLIETEIQKLRARAFQVVQQLRQQLSLLEEGVATRAWAKLADIERLREQSLEGDMRLDRRCARILALHQPVANDLRFVLAIMRMHFYVDEIGERLATIGRRLATYAGTLPEAELESLPFLLLIQRVRRLLETCLDAFFRSDVERSKQIDEEDNAVDEVYERCMERLTLRLVATQDISTTTAWVEMAIIIKTLEKIADYALDIADAYIYYAEGVYYWHRFARRSDAHS